MSADARGGSLDGLAARDRQGLKRRLLLGYGAQGFHLAVRTLEQILLVPFFIAAWGTGLYRDWLVLFAAAGFMPLLDMGMAHYFQNALRAAWAQADRATFERLLQIRLAIYLGLLATIGPLIVGAGAALVAHGLIDLHTMPSATAGAVFGLLALRNLLMLVQYYLTGIHVARNDFDRTVSFQALALVVEVTLLVVILSSGGSPPAAAAASLAVMLVFGCAALALDQAQRYPDIRHRTALPSVRELRQMVAKSLLFWLPHGGLAVHTYAPVLLLGQLAPGSAAVVTFTVARTLTGLVRQLGQQLAHASGVEMARQAAQNDRRALRSLAMTTGRLVSGLVGLLAGGLAVAAEPAVRIWTHGQVAYEPWLIGILLTTIIVITPAQIGYMALHYTNQPLPLAIAFVIQSGGGMLASALLIPELHALGAALGMGVAEMLVIGGGVSVLGLRVAKVPAAAFLGEAFGTSLAAVALGLAVGAGLRLVLPTEGVAGVLMFGTVWLGIVTVPALHLLLRQDQKSWLIGRALVRSDHP